MFVGLYGNQAALMPVLFGYEEIIVSKIDLDSLPGMTITELSEMDGRTDEVPIYLAISGRVFDVSASRDKVSLFAECFCMYITVLLYYHIHYTCVYILQSFPHNQYKFLS